MRDKIEAMAYQESRKIYREFSPKTFHRRLNFVKQICPAHGNEAASEVLGMLPQGLNAIEFRAVQRQVVQMQPLLGPPTLAFFHFLALVRRFR